MKNIHIMFSMQSLKAFSAAILAAIGAITIAATNGYTLVEILTIIAATVGAFQATYWTSNVDVNAPVSATTYNAKHGDAGYQLVEMAFAFLIIIVAVVLILRFMVR